MLPITFRRLTKHDISSHWCIVVNKILCIPNTAHFVRTLVLHTRAVLSPENRAKPCKFRYVKSVRNFMWKLCYRQDDRAMRPIRGCAKKFRDSLTTPTATIPKIFHGLLFRSTLWMFLQNLKSVAVPVPEIIGGTPKIWAAPGYATLHFLLNF